jgi:hypothetical protein
MAVPNSRSDLKDYCLRRLGSPVITINIDDDQIEDRIDDALIKYRDYHYDGTEEIYLAQKLDSGILANNYIDVPDSIVGVTRLFPLTAGSISSTNASGFNIFDINYQIRLNDFYNLLAGSYTYYYVARQHLEMLSSITTGEIPITYNKRVNRITMLSKISSRLTADDYVMFQAIRVVNPTTYSKVFSDNWLKDYTTALIKRQWGSNLTKYANYTLPGGLVVNGEKIYNDAVQEIVDLEEQLRDTFELPPQMLVG